VPPHTHPVSKILDAEAIGHFCQCRPKLVATAMSLEESEKRVSDRSYTIKYLPSGENCENWYSRSRDNSFHSALKRDIMERKIYSLVGKFAEWAK